MTIKAAYGAMVKMAGTPTEFISAPMTRRSATVFQITDVTKRMLLSGEGRDIFVTDRDLGVPIGQTGDGEFTVDYMTGTFTFTHATEVGTQYNVDAWYVPVKEIAGVMDFSVDIKVGILPNDSFDKTNSNSGARSRDLGLIDVSVALNRFYDVSDEFTGLLASRTPVMIEIKPGGVNGVQTIKGWFVIESVGTSGDVADLLKEAVSFQLGGQTETSFSWT